MSKKNIKMNKEIKEYIKNEVFPQYSKNDKGHRLDHIDYVIQRSLNFAKEIKDINLDMVYTIAVYHDIGHHINPKKHEELSAEILKQDNKLKEFFTEEEINTMYEAIIDHRASLEYEPRSIYGKIVSSADRNTNINDILRRTYEYRVNNYKNESQDEVINESYEHIKQKFTKNGYAANKMYFIDIEYTNFINEVDNLIKDKNKFIQKYKEINNLN